MEAATVERPSGLIVPDQTLWAPTASGLRIDELRGLSDDEAQVLAAWHAEVAGDVAARPFWPAAIRRLPLETRMTLASDPEISATWKERERRRVRDGLFGEDDRLLQTGVEYLVDNYGHVQPEHGPPVPFILWPEQRHVLGTMVTDLRLIILKARQLGLTWLALHHAFWILAFDPMSPVAKILALSKHGGDATKLLQRARRINELLPPYLRVEEQEETKRSLSKFGIVDRGEMISLAGTPDAARSETASYVLWDEAAFTRHGAAGDTWTALLPTLGERGRITVISTGNGPAETEGDGQTFAQLWAKAKAGDPEIGLTPIFLADSVHPERNEEQRRKERKKFLTEEDFLKEHPETEDDAFALVGGLRAYSPAGINAAEKLGREYDELLEAGELPLPEFIRGGADFGESTHLLLIWPLEGGGLYIAPGEVAPEIAQEVGESARQFCDSANELQELATSNGQAPEDGGPAPLIAAMHYDAAGIQSLRTFVKTVQKDADLLRMWATVRRAGKDQIRTPKVAFGKYKSDTIDFLRYLFTRSHRTLLTRAGDLAEEHDDYCDGTRIIAISPKNVVLLRQLRGLERKEGTGEIIKKDDHGPDALVAGAARIAVQTHDR